MEYTEGLQSPRIFRLWSGISMIAGALERRVWASYGDYVTYPNLYVMLVAPPGVGKYVIEHVRELWREIKLPDSSLPAFHVGSDSVSKASLIDEMAQAKSVRLAPEGPPLVYHSLLVASEELAVLLPTFDPEFVANLNSLFNNRSSYTESRRTSIVKSVKFPNPCLNLLVGTQPAQMADRFPDNVWDTGIARRLIMIYAPSGPLLDIFTPRPQSGRIYQRLVQDLSLLASLFGVVKWEPSGFERLREWHLQGNPPRPSHSKLSNYLNSRTMFLVKLSMISACAARGELVVRESDVTRALGWLLEAEELMPGVFRAMLGKSDGQVIDEMYEYILALWKKDRTRAVIGASLRRFLVDRTPADRIEKLIEVAERSHIIVREAPGTDLWRPGQKGSLVE